jgi:pimeloyl-ACP methyl ester carboxylesterase
MALERDRSEIAAAEVAHHIPVTVISSGDLPPGQMEAHRRLAGASAAGRHLLAAKSSHWVQFDEPDLIVAAVRRLIDRPQLY